MNLKKKNFSKNALSFTKFQIFLGGFIILSMGILIGFLVPHTQSTSKEPNINNNKSVTSKKASNDDEYVREVKELIKTKYYKQVDDSKLVNGSIKGMLDSLEDPYTTYLNQKEAQSLTDTISSSIVGIGVTVMEKDKLIVIDSVVEGSPAKKAGIKANDIIVKVNGKSVIGKRTSETTKLIRGKKGTTVEVTVKRGDQEINYKMSRDTIPIETVKHNMVNQNVGYIRVSTFSKPTTKEFKSAIEDLRQKGAKKFVIDMRGNPGGELNQALSMTSMFLKNGNPIMQVQGRNKNDLIVYRADKKYDQGFKIEEPSAVLIDGESASAAEIFAVGLKFNRIPVVGIKSFGKGTVQSVVDLPDDAELKITIAKWLTPDGTWINHKGIKPDYLVDYPDFTKLAFNDVKTPLKNGDVSPNIKSFQKGLTALGFVPGNEKGIFDAETEGAVKKFQAKREITENGLIDESTIQEMFRALSELAKKQDPIKNKAVELLQNR